MDMTIIEIRAKLIAIEDELTKIEFSPKKQKRVKQLIAVRDYLYNKMGGVINDDEQNIH